MRHPVLRMLESVRSLPAYVVSRYHRALATNPPGRRLTPGLRQWEPEARPSARLSAPRGPIRSR